MNDFYYKATVQLFANLREKYETNSQISISCEDDFEAGRIVGQADELVEMIVIIAGILGEGAANIIDNGILKDEEMDLKRNLE